MTYELTRWARVVFGLWAIGLGSPPRAGGQDGPPIIPSPTPTPTEALSDGERLRRMEAINQQLIERLEGLARKNEELSRRVDRLGAAGATSIDDAMADGAGEPPGGGDFPQAAGGGSKAGGGDPTDTGTAQRIGKFSVPRLPLTSYYDFDHDGFKWTTRDDEVSFGIRGMSQIDARINQQRDSYPASSGIYNPRTRVYFFGHFSKPIQYEFSFQNTFDQVNLLDAYLNFNYDSRLQFRVGRYKTPFTYEWYRIHVWHLLAPERSLYANNFEGNRRFGAMGWGTLFDRRLEYATGVFSTQRNSYSTFGNRSDVMAFLNAKPFYDREEGFLLRDLNFGGSVDAGRQDQAAVPEVLRLNSAPSAAGLDNSATVNEATVPWLAFNDNVRERGRRALWELHAAYYYGGLSLLAAWQGGVSSYSTTTTGPSTTLPIDGWFAQAGYILTGETIRDRTLIEPLRPFDLRPGRFGLGAFEVTGRYSTLALGDQVFTAGLADPNDWTNRVEMTDAGFNWYLNRFIKVYFDWEHAMFAQPVLYNTREGLQQSTSDTFWMRFQVYF